jgi:pyruvate/2-oxoglutarate dehydrogenase complex dihydrolipoamide acyltransferase (E2) component
MREAELSFAEQQVQLNRALLKAGAISEREVEQVETQVRRSEAQIKALDEQIKQQRSMRAYYRVTSPSAGVVGDIQVVVGDRVTKGTVLTTIDENDVLEVYINVPVQQAPGLRVGLPVRLMDDAGKLIATNRISFVSPNVDETQTCWPRRRSSKAAASSAPLPRRRSAGDRRHRPRQGAQPRLAAARGDRRAAGVPGLAVGQRLRRQQPRLPRLRAGGSTVSRQPDLKQLYARAASGEG